MTQVVLKIHMQAKFSTDEKTAWVIKFNQSTIVVDVYDAK